MGVKRWNGSAYTDLDIPKVNNVVPTAAWAWVGGAYVKLWPPVTPRSWSDNFNDRNNQAISAAGTWTQRKFNVSGSQAASTYDLYISSNQVTCSHDTNDTVTRLFGRYNSAVETEDQIVQGTIKTTNTTWPSWLFLNTSSDFMQMVALMLDGDNTDLVICRSTDGGVNFTDLARVNNVQTSNHVYRLEKIDNVYTAYRQGVSVASYTDTGNAIPLNYYGGLAMTRRRASFVNTVSPQWDDWSFKDQAA